MIAPTLFDQPGRARRGDPATSKAAARDTSAVLRWGSHRLRLLGAFYGHRDGLTDEQAGRQVGLGQVAATRRCSELRSAGLIEPTGETRALSSGSFGRVSWITTAGIAAYRRAGRQAS